MQRNLVLMGARSDAVVRYLGSFADLDDLADRADDMLLDGYVSVLAYDELTGKVALLRTADED